MPAGCHLRPAASEFAPYYARYVEAVPDGDVVALLERQGGETAAWLEGIPEARGPYRYAPGKWSLKEVIGHVMDCERVFAYRILRFARGDRTPLPGFEQDDYVTHANFDARPLADLVAEFRAVRAASATLIRSLDDEALLRRGIANNNEVSVRALIWIMAGHERHHLKVIKEKYL